MHVLYPFCPLMVAVVVGTTTLWAGEAPKAAKKADGAAKSPARWEATIKAFEAADAKQPPTKRGGVLVERFNARRWTDVADYFPGKAIVNRGFGGAHLADVLHFSDRIVLPYAPRVILLNAGGNDLSSGRTPEDVRNACRRSYESRRRSAANENHLNFAPPVLRAANSPESLAVIKNTNALLSALADEEPMLEFVDLFPAFADGGGRTRPELFVEDGTHFSAKGYAIVAELLKPELSRYLARLGRPNRQTDPLCVNFVDDDSGRQRNAGPSPVVHRAFERGRLKAFISCDSCTSS